MSHERSLAAAARLEELVPGGAHTYAKGPDQYPADCAPLIARGRGAHVWDVDGKQYLDLLGGIAVNALGHCHPRLVQAICEQAATLMHVSNLFTSVPQIELAERLDALAGGGLPARTFLAIRNTTAAPRR